MLIKFLFPSASHSRMRQTAAWNRTICKRSVPGINCYKLFSHKVKNREKLRGLGKGWEKHMVLDDILGEMKKKIRRKRPYWTIILSFFLRGRPRESNVPEAALCSCHRKKHNQRRHPKLSCPVQQNMTME